MIYGAQEMQSASSSSEDVIGVRLEHWKSRLRESTIDEIPQSSVQLVQFAQRIVTLVREIRLRVDQQLLWMTLITLALSTVEGGAQQTSPTTFLEHHP